VEEVVNQEMHNHKLQAVQVVRVEVEVKIHHQHQPQVEVQAILHRLVHHRVVMVEEEIQQVILQEQEVEVERLQLAQILQE
tara:strand:+ start:414 stop:656 length:243 start_codon:yes stop_codon:yes gene_type:complete